MDRASDRIREQGSGDRAKRGRILPLSFPNLRSVLWDHTPAGDGVRLSLCEQRAVSVRLAEQLLLLASSCALDIPRQCILVGSVHVRADGEELLLELHHFDRGQQECTGYPSSSVELLGDLHVPFTVGRQSSKLHDYELQMHMETSLMLLQSRATSHGKIDLTSHLPLRCYAYLDGSSNSLEADITFDLCVPAAAFKVVPISRVPIADIALSMSLARDCATTAAQYSASSAPDGVFQTKTGFVTMDQTRKLVLMLECDPKAFSLPLIGVWISGVDVVTHPFVWAACFRYLFDASIRDRACGDAGRDAFLVVLYSARNSRPQFYDCCFSRDESAVAPVLPYNLLTSTRRLSLKRGKQDGPTSSSLHFDLCKVVGGPRMAPMAAAVAAAALGYDSNKDIAVNAAQTKAAVAEFSRGSLRNADDSMPRTSPSPHRAKVLPSLAPCVPDVSLLFEEEPWEHDRRVCPPQDGLSKQNADTMPATSFYSGGSATLRPSAHSLKSDATVRVSNGKRRVAFALSPSQSARRQSSIGLSVGEVGLSSSSTGRAVKSCGGPDVGSDDVARQLTSSPYGRCAAPGSAHAAGAACCGGHSPSASAATLNSPPSPDVYELLRRQDAQLRLLQEQIGRLLQSQRPLQGPQDGSAAYACDPITTVRTASSQSVDSDRLAAGVPSLHDLDGSPEPRERAGTSTTKQAMCTVAVNTGVSLCLPYSIGAAGSSKAGSCSTLTQVSLGAGASAMSGDEEDDESNLVCLPTPPPLQESAHSFASSAMMLDMPSYASTACEGSGRDDGSGHSGSPLHSVSAYEDEPSIEQHDITTGAYYSKLIRNVKDLLARHESRSPKEQDELKVTAQSDASASTDHINCREPPSSATVAAATRRQMQKMGIDLAEPPTRDLVLLRAHDSATLVPALLPKVEYDSFGDCDMSSLYEPRLPSDKSMEVNALAMKYLGDEQLTQLARRVAADRGKANNSAKILTGRNGLLRTVLESARTLAGGSNLSPDVSVTSATNMSFASTKYMKRYGLLQLDEEGDKNDDSSMEGKLKLVSSSTEKENVCGPQYDIIHRSGGVKPIQTDIAGHGDYHNPEVPALHVLAGLPKARRQHARPLATRDFNNTPAGAVTRYEPVKVLDMEKLRELPKLM